MHRDDEDRSGLRAALEHVRAALSVDIATVQVAEQAGWWRVVAAAGTALPDLGAVRFADGATSPAAIATRFSWAVKIQHLRSEQRPVLTDLEVLLGARSSMAIALRDDGWRVLGVLAVHTVTPRTFSHGDVQAFEHLAADIAALM